MRLLSRFAGTPTKGKPFLSTNLGANFSVVIPTRNRRDALLQAIQSILCQSITPLQLIVVDQSATPDAGAAAQRLVADVAAERKPQLIYVHDPSIDGAASARNTGLALSVGAWVVFCDDDGVLAPDALELMGRALHDRAELIGVCGIITNYEPPSLPTRIFRRLFFCGPFWDERQPVYWHWSRYRPSDLIPTNKLNGALMAVRRTALIAIGGFDPRYCGPSIGEDVEISHRLLRYSKSTRSLAFVAGAWLRHNSLSDHSARALEHELICTHYWLRANLSHPAKNRLLYSWLFLGLTVLATISSLRQTSLEPLKGWRRAIQCIRSGYASCDFLKPIFGETSTDKRASVERL